MSWRWGIVRLLVPLFGLWAGYAHAANVDVYRDQHEKGPPGPPYVRYFGDRGEANDVAITESAGHFTVTDSKALVKAGAGCTQNGLNGATCEASGLRAYTLDLDDRIRAPGALKDFVVLDGGVGNDYIEGGGWLAGGEGDDELHGGPGADTISMGPGLDRGFGGGGDDVFGRHPLEGTNTDTRPERDEMDGGPGKDFVMYDGRSGWAEIDLARGIGGAVGENDLLVNMEGGFGNVRLIGDARDNDLTASLSSLMLGGAGDDRLSALSKSRDRIDAGVGDDIVQLSSSWSASRSLPQRDELRCGPGADAARSPAPNIIVPPDCEWADFSPESGPRVRLPQRSPSTRAPLVVVSSGECWSSNSERKRCSVRASVHRVVRARARELPELREPLASASGTFVRGGRKRLRLMPNALARRLIARGRCELASLTVIGLGYRRDQRVLFPYGRGCRVPAPIAP